MSLSLYTLIEASFPDDRTRLALEAPGRARGPRDWSFDRLSAYAARYAALFTQLGLKPGDRVALQVEKSPEGSGDLSGLLARRLRVPPHEHRLSHRGGRLSCRRCHAWR